MSETVDLTGLFSDVKEQVLYLQELGVDTLDVKLRETVVESGELSSENGEPAGLAVAAVSNLKSEISISPETPRISGSRLASLPTLSKRPTSAPMRSAETAGADERSEVFRSVPADAKATAGPAPAAPQKGTDETLFGHIAPALPEPVETIEHIRAEIGNCTRCPLHAGRKQIVHSHGSFQADLMFVGEAPGADEDEQGFPFVGRAGKLLTDIIEAIGFNRESVFIGNINRCRPPGNRAPVPLETAACRPYLLREIAVVRPKVIVVLGNTAMHNLLDIKTPISKLRGNFQDYFGVKVMPTFHPAYLLRDPHKKREVWEDMKMVRDYLNS